MTCKMDEHEFDNIEKVYVGSVTMDKDGYVWLEDCNGTAVCGKCGFELDLLFDVESINRYNENSEVIE